MSSLDDQFISELIELLDLDDNGTQSKILVNQLIIDGRQTLPRYQDDIAPNVYNRQMAKDDSQLLTVLKNCIEHQWQSQTEKWLQTFLEEEKNKSFDLYDQILTRTAEYGSKYLKDSTALSLVLQFLFEFDDQTLENESLFDDIWKTLITNGRQSLQRYYTEHLAPAVMREQLDNVTSALSLALREYFHQPLSDLLAKIQKPNLIEVCLKSVVNYGWLEGLKRPEVQDGLAPNKHKTLIKELRQYLQDRNIDVPDATTNASQSTENPILINSSLPALQQTTAPSTVPIPTTTTVLEPLLAMTSSTIDDTISRRDQEISMIRTCIDGYQKWQLKNLVQAGELLYIDQKFPDVTVKIVEVYREDQNFPEFINKCLQSIMFLLKRHQNLDDFSKRLFFNYFSVQLSSLPLNMRMIEHILLLKSDYALSRMIMSLLSKRNSVPFLQPTLGDVKDYQFVPDIIHVWNYHIPTILSFGIGKCEGKSRLLNAIFMSSFEQSSSSIYFQETIDIDFGYHFLSPRSTNIADAHGSMTKELLTRIHDLFDGFLLHIDFNYMEQNCEIIKSYLNIITQTPKYCLILVRDVPEKRRSQYSCETPIQTFALPNISDLNKIQNQHALHHLCNKIFETIPTTPLHDKYGIQTRLKALLNGKYQEQMLETYEIIKPLEDILLDAFDNENAVIEHFPLYTIYTQLCALSLRLASFNFYGSENDTDVFAVHQQIDQLDNAFRAPEQNAGTVFDLFVRVLQSPNVLLCLDLLSTDLKRERARLVPTAEMSKQLPIHKSLSMEILWRNAIISGSQQSDHLQKFLHNQYYQYIQAGYPFEIVDGDNFYFHHHFLSRALALFRDKKTLVISVIGPQNSGKSTLLNYMFGTLFDVRDGRCTRGIYGSFVKSNRKNFDYIMLIDTEGLLGVEREDPAYDRRIVLFCLAVSHLVIVNMVGEFNLNFQNMLSLCTESLRQMGVTRIPQPTVHFILNQKADLNTDNNRVAIERILSDLKKTGPTIDIQIESFHTLPSAFTKETNLTSNPKMPRAIKTEPDFLERVQLLCGELIQSAESVFCRSTELSDPVQWLKSSFTIFQTLQKFSDLTFYHDINERQQDNEVREHIRKTLTQIFSSTFRNQLIEQSITCNENELVQMFEVQQHQIQDFVNHELEKVLKLLQASETIRIRSKQFLNTQIIATFKALRTTSIVANEREKIKLFFRDGEGALRQLIDDTIHSGVIMFAENASEKFDTMFNNSLEYIQTKFVPKELVSNALKYIYTNYNIYEKEGLPDYQYISDHLPMLVNFNESQLSIDDLQDEFILAFTNLANREHQPVEVHPFTHDTTNLYSFDQIENLVYLNKEVFCVKFIEYLKKNYPQLILQQQPSVQEGSNNSRSKNRLGDFWKELVSKFRENNHQKHRSSSQPVLYTTNFLRDVRKNISAQKPILNPGVIDERNMYLRISVFIREIIQMILKEMQAGSPSNEVRQIQTDLIQKIVGLINTLIINIDNELRPFCLSLSRQLKSVFHICAITLLTAFYFNEQKTHFQQTLSELNTKRDDLKNYFVQMVVPNASADTNYALTLVEQLQECLVKHFKVDGQRLINIELQKYDYLNRKWMQERCDGQLLMNNDTKWLMRYIENPTNIIEYEFKQLWENVLKGINQKLIEIKSNYNSIFIEFFFCLQGIFDALKTFRCSSATFVSTIFQPQDNNSLNANENLTHKKRCMAILLYHFMSGPQIPQTFVIKTTIQNIEATTTYALKKDVFDIFQLLIVQRPPGVTLGDMIRKMSSTFDRISIDNLAAFLEQVLNQQTRLLSAFSELKNDFNTIDKQDTYARLLDKVRGCPNLCPCCNRPCDVDHTQIKSRPGSLYNEHRCATGHALRAMNGYKFEATNEASLLMCEHIKDDQIIIIGPQRIKWLKFKSNHRDWNFSSTLNDEELRKLHSKFLNVWAKIGPELCQKYDMKYVVFNTNQQNVITYESFHWILLLDGSGSMAGKPWKDLLQAVDEFMKHRSALNTMDRITIIIFSDKATYAYDNDEIKNVQISNIQYPMGVTNFSNAFARVYECIKRTQTTSNPSGTGALNYAIIFMTDGEDAYPQEQLNQLVNEYGTAIRFWTLALGADLDGQATSILEQINDKMHGSYYSLAASSELSETFSEIANNTNSNSNSDI